MYYLILKDLENEIKFVGNCETAPHKTVILKNYCLNNDVTLVTDRKDINDQCKGTDLIYAYPILDNKYVILKCTYHDSNMIFNSYVEKHNIGHFEFHYFKPEDLKLRKLEIEETLIYDEMKKINKQPGEQTPTNGKRKKYV